MNWPSYLLGVMTGMAALDIARRVGMIAWTFVVFYMAKPLWRVLKGQPRFHDMLWCSYGSIAFLILMYGVRAIYAPNSQEIYLGLHILSGAVAVNSLFTIRAYMRSHRAHGHG